jgi:hypothetical protein
MLKHRRKAPESMWLHQIKQQALDEAYGKCQCTTSRHKWHNGYECGRDLGSTHYFHYTNSAHTRIVVICSKCHSDIVSSRRRIY